MKPYTISLILTFVIISFSCNNKNIAPTNEDNFNTIPINKTRSNNVREWVKVGCKAYGIAYTKTSEDITAAKPIPIKIIHIEENRIKVKAISIVYVTKTKNCDKSKVSYGETWWEKDGDIFKTETEAINRIIEKGWVIYN